MPKLNSVKLTDTYVRNSIKPPIKGRVEHFDSQMNNLCLRVSSTGNMSWCFYYRLGGSNRKITIGSYPTYSIAEARVEAAEAKKLADRNIDPVAARKIKRAEIAAVMAKDKEPPKDSVDAMAQLFIERYVEKKLKKSTAKDYKAHFRLYIVPTWKGRTVGSISKKDVTALLDKVEDRAPVQCNRVQSTLSKWFNWMAGRGVLDSSPIFKMDKRTTENARKRILADDELRSIWKACEKKSWPFGPIDQLLLLTAKRRAEVVGMRWSEVDFEQKIWTIPGDLDGRTKNKIEEAVPLSNQVITLLRSLARFPDVDLVFPASNGSGNPVSGFSRAKKKMDELSGVEAWTLHDLRRTVRTNLSALRIPKEISDRVLHHVDRSVDGIYYDMHDYLDQKREALQIWADRLDVILSDGGGDNVVTLRGA